MTQPLLFLSLDIAIVLSGGLLAARAIAAAPRQASAWLIAAIVVCNICHVVLARHDYGQWIPADLRLDASGAYPVLNLVRNLTPGLFMILCHGLFSERRLPRVLLALFAVQVALESGRTWMPANWLLSQVAPASLQMLFAAAAMYWALADWRADLVETRRRARAVTVVIIGVNVIAVSLLLRLVIPWNTPANYYGYVAFAALNLVTLLVLLSGLSGEAAGRYLELARDTPAPRAAIIADTTEADLARLLDLFEVEHLHREPGLALNDVALRAGLPEYRLRRLIHEQLGYKNFNAFLHSWRIREACIQLRDPALSRTPILTIALSLGYQSVNTFNRGFVEVTGMTPSAWRNGK